jgi:UDP-N-acetylglucosamine/UDP-N-acetylgalactosamine diphosphorylase
MLIDRDARRMEAAGIAIPRNAEGKVQCILEISPRCVVDEADAIAFFGKNPVPAPIPGAICFYGK